MIDEMSSFMKVKDFGHVLDALTSLVFTCYVLKQTDSARSQSCFYCTENNVISCTISLIQVK